MCWRRQGRRDSPKSCEHARRRTSFHAPIEILEVVIAPTGISVSVLLRYAASFRSKSIDHTLRTSHRPQTGSRKEIRANVQIVPSPRFSRDCINGLYTSHLIPSAQNDRNPNAVPQRPAGPDPSSPFSANSSDIRKISAIPFRTRSSYYAVSAGFVSREYLHRGLVHSTASFPP